MRLRFCRSDNGQMVLPKSGVRIVAGTRGRLQVWAPALGPAGQLVECVLPDGELPNFGTLQKAAQAARLMLAFSDCEYRCLEEPEHKRISFVIVSGPKRSKQTKRKAKLYTPTRPSTDPIVLLGTEISDQDISIGLRSRLRELGVVYLWEALRRPQYKLSRDLGTRYWKQFVEYVKELGFESGEQLPEGDYPWNKS